MPVNYQTSEIVGTVCASSVESKPVSWLVTNILARGAINVLAGPPGLGKSQVTMAVTASCTNRQALPGTNIFSSFGSVIILAPEDDYASTQVPRLRAAGADLDKVHFLTFIYTLDKNGKNIPRAFSLQKDLDNLGVLIESFKDVVLIIIDPISAFFGNIDSHNASEVRALLTPLNELASKHGVCVLVVTHLNKSMGGSAMNRITGSTSLIAAARTGYMIAADPDDKDRRLFMPVKNNLAKDKNGFAFRIESVLLDEDIETSRIVLEPDSITIDPDDVLNSAITSEDRSALSEAVDFLEGLLADGPVLQKQIMNEARQAGHSEASIKRARAKLNVRARKRMGDGKYEWSLPDHVDQDKPPFNDDLHEPHEPHVDNHVAQSSQAAQVTGKKRGKKK